jgi:hypothetical protein
MSIKYVVQLVVDEKTPVPSINVLGDADLKEIGQTCILAVQYLWGATEVKKNDQPPGPKAQGPKGEANGTSTGNP